MQNLLFKLTTPNSITISKDYSLSNKNIVVCLNEESDFKVNVNQLSDFRVLSNLDEIKTIEQYFSEFYKTLNIERLEEKRTILGNKKSKEYLKYLNAIISETLEMLTTYHHKFFLIRKNCYMNLSTVMLGNETLKIPKYNHAGVTGRTSITEGFNFLTLKKNKRKELKFKDNNYHLIEVDFKSCEPFFYLLSNNFTVDNNDVYEWIARKYDIDISKRDKIKRGILSMIYGANEYTISKVMGIKKSKVELIKDELGIYKLKKVLSDQFSQKGYVYNFYGRPITNNNNLVNYWIQSSTVDFCSFAFVNFIKTYKVKPCFFIHDSLTFAIEKSRMSVISDVTYFKDPISNIKIPVEFNIIS